MKMRRLTEAEVQVVLDEHLAVRTWEQHIGTYRQFARDVFGPDAAIISLGLGLVYNDEDNQPGVATAAVYDVDRTPLAPVPEPWPWPAHRLPEHFRLRDMSGRPIPVVALHVSKHDDPLPVPEGPLMTYSLDRPPLQAFDTVYVLVDRAGNVDSDRADPPLPMEDGRYRRISVDDLDQLRGQDFDEYELRAARQFVQYVYGPGAAYVDLQLTAETGGDGFTYTRQRVSVHDAAAAELPPIETNANRSNWLGALLPWTLMGDLEQEARAAISKVLGEDVKFIMEGMGDGRTRYLSPKGINPRLLERSLIYRIDRSSSQVAPAMYVEDIDYSAAYARVSEGWRFPVIPLAASTDWVYDGSPIGDFGMKHDHEAGDDDQSNHETETDRIEEWDIPF